MNIYFSRSEILAIVSQFKLIAPKTNGILAKKLLQIKTE